MSQRSMIISIIGRPNVGKSSLFNRLLNKSSKAITFNKPGVTRDRHYGIAHFDDLPFCEKSDAILIDTGGLYAQKIDETNGSKEERRASRFFNIMIEHAKLAIEESDLVLFMVDVREGPIPLDKDIANYIRQAKKNFWTIINKCDSDKQEGLDCQFYSLGVDSNNLFSISAAHGRGIIELRERIHQEIIDFQGREEKGPGLQKGVTPKEDVVAKLAIIGAPNAGKSTLLNQLIGAQRALVSEIPGTTVDPIEGFFDQYFGKEVALFKKDDRKRTRSGNMLIEEYKEFQKNNPSVFNDLIRSYTGIQVKEGPCNKEMSSVGRGMDALNSSEESNNSNYWRSLHIVDTAGIRKAKKVGGYIESQSVYRSLRCITESDIVLFMIDCQIGIGHQDRRLMDIALEKGKSLIILLNKVDLLEDKIKEKKARIEWLRDLRDVIPWLEYCDLIPISAKNRRYFSALRESIKKTVLVRNRIISTGILNKVVLELVEKNPHIVKRTGGKRLKIKYASMIKSSPPTFLLFVNRSKGIGENYCRYLKNGLRREFLLYNTPVHLIFRAGGDLDRS